MFEETNQTMDTTATPEDTHSDIDLDDLFDLDDDEGNQLTEDESNEDETQQHQEESEVQKPETNAENQKKPILTVKHLGVEKQLSEDEARALAQKGMDYDHLRQQYDGLKNSEELALLDQMAAEMGMDRASYIKALSQFNQNQAAAQYVEELKKQYPNTDEAVLQELAKTQLTQRQEQEKQAKLTQQQQAEKAQKEAFAAQYQAFVSEYPDIDPTKLPDDVIQSMASGETMLSAYRAYELKKIKSDYAALIKNKDNSQKALGDVKGKPQDDEDAFLLGFDS
ncbi:hypothetical protein [Holdemania massiliensis]|uniref:hypothetical protein n=1 Tax=Holdemania massiliensis TaxID=1468449 RepID=UPI0026768F68|nr:hypothetical protein [Holdemania massiliensis]